MAKKFRFKLEALIVKRRHVLEIAQKNLQKIRTRLREEQQKVETINAKITDVTVDYGKMQQEGHVHADQLLRYVSFLRDLKIMLSQQEDNVRKVADAESKAIERLVKADQELKIVERLKEKQHAEYLKEQERLEQQEMDEIAVLKYKPKDWF